MSSFLKSILCRSHFDTKKRKHSYMKLEVGENAATIMTPEGFVPIYVREKEDDEAELIKYLVPIRHLSCPPLKDFIEQSQEAEFEISFDGPITLVCTADMFEQLLEACRD